MTTTKKILTKSFVLKLTQNVHEVITSLNETQLVALVSELDHLYYNKGESPLSDDLYDIIKNHLSSLDPKSVSERRVGAPVARSDNRKEKLPFYMGSMDKIKADNSALDTFRSKYTGSWILSDKLDGNSALLHVRGGEAKLFSRGNGIEGQNISHILHKIRGIPCELLSGTCVQDMTIRGELIMSKDDFEKVSDQGANARNMVAGLINAKRPNMDLLRYVQFVAYTLITPGPHKPSDQLEWLYKNGFTIVYNEKVNASLCTFDQLSNILVQRRSLSTYDIDGIIVTHDAPYQVEHGKNPSYAFAFKNLITQDTAEVVVTNVSWNISKDGYIKPVVEFEGVRLAGVVIKRATGFNGDYISKNKVGPGARIIITRSGDVIPYILRVLTPAEVAQMPDVPFEWTESGKEIIVKGSHSEIDYKQVENFFTKVKVRGLSSATIRKLYDSGLTTAPAILNAPTSKFISVIGAKNGVKIAEGIAEVKANIGCVTLMDASNMFGRGFGEKRLKTIVDTIPKIMDNTYVPSKEELTAIEGVSDVTAEKFIFGLQRYHMFLKDSKIQCTTPSLPHTKYKQSTSSSSLKLADQVVLFTGFRNKDLRNKVEELGGRVVEAFSKKVTILVTKDGDSDSTKVKQAKALGTIKIMSIETFEEMLN